jgi:hypothetical protein
MNQFFFESRGREKVNDLMNEGMRSQAYHRSGASRGNLLSRLPKFVLIVLVILGILQMVVR